MTKKYLHLLPDDPKHIPYVIGLFSSALLADSENEFIIIKAQITEPEDIEIAGIKVRQFPPDIILLNKIVVEYKFVFIHFLDVIKQKIICAAATDTVIVWLIWGGDFYECHPQIKNTLYEEMTKKIYNEDLRYPIYNGIIARHLRATPLLYRAYLNLRRFYKKSFLEKLIEDRLYLKAFKRVNYFGALEEECKLVKKATKNKAQGLNILFNSVDEYIADIDVKKIKLGINITIGNSATLSGNHLDVFSLLKNFNIENKKVIVPLSYGEDLYKKIILNKGRKFFGKQFSPLIDFLPRKIYIELLSSCNVMIMNHIRQQAVGNIIAGLYMGMKVFLNKKSPLCEVLKNRGIIFFTVQDDLVPDNSNALTALTTDAIDINRKQIDEYWNKGNVLKCVKEMYSRVSLNLQD